MVSQQLGFSNILHPLFVTASINWLPEIKRRGKAVVHLFKADIFLGLRQKVLWIIKFKWLSDIWGRDRKLRERKFFTV